MCFCIGSIYSAEKKTRFEKENSGGKEKVKSPAANVSDSEKLETELKEAIDDSKLYRWSKPGYRDDIEKVKVLISSYTMVSSIFSPAVPWGHGGTAGTIVQAMRFGVFPLEVAFPSAHMATLVQASFYITAILAVLSFISLLLVERELEKAVKDQTKDAIFHTILGLCEFICVTCCLPVLQGLFTSWSCTYSCSNAAECTFHDFYNNRTFYAIPPFMSSAPEMQCWDGYDGSHITMWVLSWFTIPAFFVAAQFFAMMLKANPLRAFIKGTTCYTPFYINL
jgi:hypothetical protein